MKNVIIAAAFVAASSVSALAKHAAPAANSDGDTPAVATSDTTNPTAPVEGANSFTEGQAKQRIQKAGCADVEDLNKDDKASGMLPA